MEDYKSNSDKSKVKPKIEPVVSGPVTVKKKSEFKKFTEALITRDFKSISSFVVGDVLIPAGKKAIEELVHMILHGEASRGSSGPASAASKVSYRSYWDKRDDLLRPDYRGAAPVKPRMMSGYNYDEVEFDTFKDADSVLARMNEIISIYGVVSVADLYDLARISDDNYTNNSYGWADISTAEVIPTRYGKFIISLPKVMPFN